MRNKPLTPIPSSAAAHETLAEVAQMHGRQGYSDEFAKAAQLAPSAARWVNVAETCSLASCRLSALQHALHSNPRDAKANALLASYYVDRRQLQKARTLLQTAATSDPGDFVIAKQLADVNLAMGRRSARHCCVSQAGSAIPRSPLAAP